MPTYHSFPRTAPPDCDYDEFGLAILNSIIDIGLVLVPEMISMDEHFEDGTSNTLRIGQKRLCLSDIESGKLWEHSKKFGRFAIEWQHSVAMELGAMPVFYFPEVAKGAVGLTNLSGTLICRLAETVSLLKTLKDFLDHARESNLELPTPVEQKETGAQLLLDTASTKRLLEHLNANYRGFFELEANIRALAQLFVPTHNSTYTDSLNYYRQREWRIISDIEARGAATSRELTEAEKKRVASINASFFEKEVDTITGRDMRINQCRLYLDVDGQHPLAKATAVVVPNSAVRRAEELLERAGIDVSVKALESEHYGCHFA